jgi:glycogen synthase
VNEAKSLNKEDLQSATGLPVDRNIPLIVFIGRLEEKNGPEILAAAASQVMDETGQFIFLVSTHSPDEIYFLSLMGEKSEHTIENILM